MMATGQAKVHISAQKVKRSVHNYANRAALVLVHPQLNLDEISRRDLIVFITAADPI